MKLFINMGNVRRTHDVVHYTRLITHADMHLHADLVNIAFHGLVRFRIVLAVSVLGRAGAMDQLRRR